MLCHMINIEQKHKKIERYDPHKHNIKNSSHMHRRNFPWKNYIHTGKIDTNIEILMTTISNLLLTNLLILF